MNHGRLVAGGTVSELIGSAGSVYVEVDDRDRARTVLASVAGVDSVANSGDGLIVEHSGGRRSDLVAALTTAGVRVETIMQTQRLEDAFLDLLEGRRLPAPGEAP